VVGHFPLLLFPGLTTAAGGGAASVLHLFSLL
jgi:hypothetical protein